MWCTYNWPQESVSKIHSSIHSTNFRFLFLRSNLHKTGYSLLVSADVAYLVIFPYVRRCTGKLAEKKNMYTSNSTSLYYCISNSNKVRVYNPIYNIIVNDVNHVVGVFSKSTELAYECFTWKEVFGKRRRSGNGKMELTHWSISWKLRGNYIEL